jgi:nucleoside-diphosphate-sugar epimerase
MLWFENLPENLAPSKDYWKGRNVFITGGTGFLGSYIVELLVHNEATIDVLDNGATGCDLNLSHIMNKIDVYEGSINDVGLVDKLVSKASVVFHLASHMEVRKAVESPAIDFSTNVVGSHNIFDAVRRFTNVKKFIYASSCAVYGNSQDKRTPVPNNPYGAAKRALEIYGTIYRDIFDVPFYAIRLFSLVGPRMRQTVIYDLLRRLSQNPRELKILGDGTVVRDFNDVRIAAAVFVKLAEVHFVHAPIMDLSGLCAESINDIAKEIISILGLDGITRLQYTGATWAGDMKFLKADNSQIQKAIGEIPKYDIRKGLEEYIDWADATFKFKLREQADVLRR